MPYNYLLDMNVRMIMETKVSNTIVIFDEAHNIESVSEEGVSFDITTNNFIDCETDIKILTDKSILFPEETKTSSKDLALISDVIKNFSKNFKKWSKKLEDELKPKGMPF